MSSENLERGDDGRFVSPSSDHGWTPPADVGEIAFGLESVERSMGYTPNQPTAELEGDDLADEQIALESLYPEGADEPVVDGINELSTAPATYINRETGEPLDPNITLTPEEAADNYSAYTDQLVSYVEGNDLANLIEVVDQARADALRANPADAAEYGLDPQEVEANVKGKEQPADQLQNAKPDPVQEEPEIPGLDPEVARAVRNPQVRQFLEDQVTQNEAVRQQYQTGLDVANKVALAELETLLPDIAALPVHQREGALAHLAHSDPGRFMQAAAKMQQISQVQAAQAEQQQYSAARTQAEFNQWAKAEDARVNASDADAKAVRDYLPELGLDSSSFVHLMQTDRTLRSALGQRALIDAAKYHQLMNAPKALSTRPQARSVQRPGSGNSKSSRDVTIGELESRLARTGSEDDGWALLQARMRR
jgi:hypothetical protein